MIRINQKLKDKLWWLVISVDYDYSRIQIADHECTTDLLTLWLQDAQDFRNSLEECLLVEITTKELCKIIKAEKLNSYEGCTVDKDGNITKKQIEVNEPIVWYLQDATVAEQTYVRDDVLKQLLTQLIENEAASLELAA
jgi:hypothetical protein